MSAAPLARDTITFASPSDGRTTLAKVIHIRGGRIVGKDPSPNVPTFDYTEAVVHDLRSLYIQVKRAAAHDAIAVRAKPKSPTGNRRIHETDGIVPNLEVVPRRWVRLRLGRPAAGAAALPESALVMATRPAAGAVDRRQARAASPAARLPGRLVLLAGDLRRRLQSRLPPAHVALARPSRHRRRTEDLAQAGDRARPGRPGDPGRMPAALSRHPGPRRCRSLPAPVRLSASRPAGGPGPGHRGDQASPAGDRAGQAPAAAAPMHRAIPPRPYPTPGIVSTGASTPSATARSARATRPTPPRPPGRRQSATATASIGRRSRRNSSQPTKPH